MNETPGRMPGTGSECFVAGDLRVDVGQQRVTRAGAEITLPNLSFQLLLALIRVAPNLLSVESLMTRVWPGLVVSPETVAKRVNLLREALGDDAQDPHYIAGVRGRGYRLVAAVTQANELSSSDPAQMEPGTVQTKPSRSWWLALPVVAAAIFAIALGVRTVHRARVVGSAKWRAAR